jgi:flavin-dependent dehydrogenase
MLGELGLGLPGHVLESPQLFVVRAIDLPHRLERYYQRHYININRDAFDRWLISLVPPSVELRLGCRFVSCRRQGGASALELSDEKRKYIEQASIIVAADGAGSNVRKCCFPQYPWPKTYIAIQEWFAVNEPLPYFSAIFDPEVTDFYAWAIPKGDSLAVGAALEPREQPSGRFELLKRKLREYGFKLDRRLMRKGARLLRPVHTSQICVGGEGVALVGEAAGWISPSSGEGLSYAFRSAVILADALNRGLAGFSKRYRLKTVCLKRNILLKNIKSRFIYAPRLREIIMRSGLKTVRLARE